MIDSDIQRRTNHGIQAENYNGPGSALPNAVVISLLRASQRHHGRRRKRDVWRTFAALDGGDRLAEGFGVVETLDESRLPPFTEVVHHAHHDAEIITYVREGAITCEDSIGHAGVIQAGEFQRMSAVPGMRYSETNASRSGWAHVFEIGLRCARVARDPGQEQRRFSAAERRGGLCLVASPDARQGSLRLRQDTGVYAALLLQGQHVVHELRPERAAWLHLVHGEVALGDIVLYAGDGAGFTAERAVALTAREDSEILMLDVQATARASARGLRLAELPGMTNLIHLKDYRPGPKSDTAFSSPKATKTLPGLAVAPPVSEVPLEQAVHTRRGELIGRLIEHRRSMHLDEVGAGDKVKAMLSELANIMREDVVDGWTNIGDGARRTLDRWLVESADYLAMPIVAPKGEQ